MLILALDKSDEPTVWEFLRLAAHEDGLDAVPSNPQLARYARDWGRVGDFGFMARSEDATVGLIWARLFPLSEPGFGWLSEQIPEISLAVSPEFRGRGIGRLLLEALISHAQHHYEALSLNVRSDNQPAIKIYEDSGFNLIPGSEILNRTGGTSFTMSLKLARPITEPDASTRASGGLIS